MPINQRQSPSSQNPGPGGTVPQNQMIPQAPGNPRYKPGIGPDPNPRVVVKAVNPPVTPDQVVSMAEIPAAATIELPKIQNIKIPPVKNKTVQGHLKAIEAKMIATEKLMKDIVKLQRVQIHTEKELFERKRELYQNTFEEYLLDKTIDFEDPDNPPDCTCINLPKKPPGGPGLPPTSKPPRKPPNKPTGEAPVAELPDWARGIDLAALAAFMGITLLELIKMITGGTLSPQAAYQAAPSLFAKAPPGVTPAGVDSGVTPKSAALSQPDLSQDSGMEEWLRSGEFDPVSQAAAPAITPEEATRQLNEEIEGQQSDYGGTFTPVKEQPVSPDPPQPSFADSIASSAFSLYNQFENFRGAVNDTPLMRAIGPSIDNIGETMDNNPMIEIGMGMAMGGGAQGIKIAPSLFARMFPQQYLNMSKFFARARAGASVADDVAPVAGSVDDAVVTITGSADDVAATATSTAKTPVTGGGMTARQRALMRGGSRGPQRGRGTSRLRGNQDKLDERRVDRLIEQLDNQSTPSNVRSQIDRTSLEETLRRPSAGGSGSRVVKNKDGWETNVGKRASGSMGDVDLFNSDALNYFRGMSSKIVPMADGGFMGWFNKGLNARFPNESTARFGNPLDYFSKNPDPTTLFGDDAIQRGQSNKNFKAGKKPSVFGRPDRAVFGRDLLDWHRKPSRLNPMGLPRPRYVPAELGGPGSAPTPIQREIVKRPVRAMRSNIQNPLLMALEFIVNDLLINPPSTAVYDQVTGPNAYYNDPAYKGPMPSQNLENAQSSMMSGNNDQKPEVVPLPPDYIKIPGKSKATDFVGNESPDIEMTPSIFSRSSTHID